MRAKEFILLEYNHQVTAKALGLQLINKLKSEGPEWTQRVGITFPKNYDSAQGMKVMSLSGDMDPEELVEYILARIEHSCDPTPHKEYSQWIARTYIKSNWHLEDLISKLQDPIEKFNTLKIKKKLTPQQADINSFKDFNTFYNFVETTWENVAKQQPNLAPKGQAQEIYNDAEIRVIVPQDQDAACYYGQGTRWCTASTKGENMFNAYNRQGPLYIVIPKHPKHLGEKYQLHFTESRDRIETQVMDEGDNPVSLKELVELYPSLKLAFNKLHPDIPAFMDDDQLKAFKESIEEKLWIKGRHWPNDVWTLSVGSGTRDDLGITWVEILTGQSGLEAVGGDQDPHQSWAVFKIDGDVLIENYKYSIVGPFGNPSTVKDPDLLRVAKALYIDLKQAESDGFNYDEVFDKWGDELE
jgi:hypothetical protein